MSPCRARFLSFPPLPIYTDIEVTQVRLSRPLCPYIQMLSRHKWDWVHEIENIIDTLSRHSLTSKESVILLVWVWRLRLSQPAVLPWVRRHIAALLAWPRVHRCLKRVSRHTVTEKMMHIHLLPHRNSSSAPYGRPARYLRTSHGMGAWHGEQSLMGIINCSVDAAWPDANPREYLYSCSVPIFKVWIQSA